MRTWTVYHIVDAKGRTRYVGCAQSLKARWSSHLTAALQFIDGKQRDYQAVTRWLAREVYACNTPVIVPVASCKTRQSGLDAEADEIKRLLGRGHPLLNCDHANGRGRRSALRMPMKKMSIAARSRRWWSRLGEISRSEHPLRYHLRIAPADLVQLRIPKSPLTKMMERCG